LASRLTEINDWTDNNRVNVVRNLLIWIRARKIDFLRTMLLSIFASLVPIRAFWFAYSGNPVLMKYGKLYTVVSEWVPRLQLVDYVAIFLIYFVAGFLVVDLEKVVVHWVISSVLSLIFSTAWVFLFMWYVLEASEVFPVLGFWIGTSYVVHYAFLNVFRMIFPFVVVFSFVACLIGAFIGEKISSRS